MQSLGGALFYKCMLRPHFFFLYLINFFYKDVSPFHLRSPGSLTPWNMKEFFPPHFFGPSIGFTEEAQTCLNPALFGPPETMDLWQLPTLPEWSAHPFKILHCSDIS